MGRIWKNIDLDEDIELIKDGWKIQKVLWPILFAILVLAAFGLFGFGPLSYCSQSQNSATLEYERFLRYEAESELVLKLHNVFDTSVVVIPKEYLNYIQLGTITPRPQKAESVNGKISLYFPVRNSTDIYITILARKPGYYKGQIEVNNSNFYISHLIYP